MEPTEMINNIIEIERKAQQIADQANEKLKKLPEELKSECERLRSDFLSRADRRIKIVDENEIAAADEQIKLIDKRLKESMASIEASLAQNRKIWVDTLFNSIVGK